MSPKELNNIDIPYKIFASLLKHARITLDCHVLPWAEGLLVPRFRPHQGRNEVPFLARERYTHVPDEAYYDSHILSCTTLRIGYYTYNHV